MRRTSFAEMTCPIARTLEVVGEWWTLLIVRDALLGATRFDEFRRTGIADNILSARLDRLVSEGILERRSYQEHPPRQEYVLTDKGQDLLPVVMAMGAWGLKYTDVKPAVMPRLIHKTCGSDVGYDFRCPACDEVVEPREIDVRRVQSSDPKKELHPATLH